MSAEETVEEIEAATEAEQAPPEPPAPLFENPVTIALNGVDTVVDGDKMLIDAVEDAGEYIPRFCYHPRMTPVGMCRMCIVECDTGRGPALTPTCMIKAAPEMKVETESELTKDAQDGVLELLLINHPLDCPVCDKGGECPLQDQTMAYGPGESRFVEEKRHFEKPIAISETVYLDRERCILCDRCTRFADEVAGDPLIHFMDRGNQTQVNTFPDEPFSSYFSGNTVQICPVGALTAKPYRFKARPWDLNEVESTYPNAMGDRITIQASRNEILRFQGVDSDPVNWGWLADRDRFSFEASLAETRITQPLVRGDALGNPKVDGADLVAAPWPYAAGIAADAIRNTLKTRGPGAIGIIGGARLTNESQYAWTKLAKGIIKTDNVDAQLADGLKPEVLFALRRATIDQACAPGGTVILMAGDPKEEMGTLFLRLRHAAIKDKVSIVELTPTATGLSHLASHSVRVRPGDLGAVAHAVVTGESDQATPISADDLAVVREAMLNGPVTVIAGRTSLAESDAHTMAALGLFATLENVSFLPVLRRGNIAGALDMGMSPGLLPGRVDMDRAGTWFARHWGASPASIGLDTTGMLTAAAEGQLDVLILLGSDPLRDFPDRRLAERGLRGASVVIAVDGFANPSVAEYADVVLPSAGIGEVEGTHTNIEGRITAINQKVTPPGTCRADWMIAAELAWKLNADLGFESLEGIVAEISEVSSAHAGMTLDAIQSAGDGLIVPLSDDTGLRPEMISSFSAFGAAIPPRNDAYSFRLIADRTMFDNGTIVANSAAIAPLGGAAEIRMAPSDLARLGINSRTQVQVVGESTTINGLAVADSAVPPTVVAIAVNHDATNPCELIDINQPVTDVRIVVS